MDGDKEGSQTPASKLSQEHSGIVFIVFMLYNFFILHLELYTACLVYMKIR